MDRQRRGEWLQQQVEEAVADLESQMSKGHTEEFLNLLTFYGRFHKCSLADCLLIMTQKPDATLCAGFKTWAKLGYHVRRGERAIFIRGPIIKKLPDPQTGEIKERITGYIAVPVFDRSQLVEEVEFPSPRYDLDGDYDEVYLQARVAIGANGILVDEEPLPSGIHGMSVGGRIIINPMLPTSLRFLTILHEIAHEVMHKGEDRQETTKEQRELEAESCSFLLARLYGLENPFSRDYVLSWEGTVTDLHASMTRIHQAVKQIADLLNIQPPQAVEQAA